VVRDEAALLPVWLRYYLAHVPAADILVLDHGSEDAATAARVGSSGVRVINVSNDQDYFTPRFKPLQQVGLERGI